MTKCPPKNNCTNCDNAEKEEEGIDCLLHGWYFPTYVAKKSTCDKRSEEACIECRLCKRRFFNEHALRIHLIHSCPIMRHHMSQVEIEKGTESLIIRD